MNFYITLLSTWFGCGRIKKAPGTWGTLGAIPVYLLLNHFNPYGYMLATLLFSGFAILIAHIYEQQNEGHDRSEVVIDEVAGYLVTMTWLPATWISVLAGFILFRALDILKPPPISIIDKKIQGGVGVVADDLVAGIIANFILQILFVQTSWLGYQWPS